MDNNAKTQVVERLRQAQNVLITVSDNPSVDQLSAAIGFTLLMNKLNKHATAVFSGQIPSTIEFLQPEDTLEKNTDSLRDFIIALDKSKADKLRYKVEENVVKIFITPYRTSLGQEDLEFSQGDFNVDVVIALGVDDQDHIDKAIEAHGRILHDATVVGVMAGDKNFDIGGINWQDSSASSLCEMLVSISEAFQSGLLDEQMATAFLTGIVSETERFSNDKTTPKVMTMAAQLMAAGANQQLIANKLEVVEEPPAPEPEPAVPVPELPADAPLEPSLQPQEPVAAPEPELPAQSPDEGVIELRAPQIPFPPPPTEPEDNASQIERIDIDKQGTLRREEEMALHNAQMAEAEAAKNAAAVKAAESPPTEQETAPEPSKYVEEPPQMGGTLTASAQSDAEEPNIDPLSVIPQASVPEGLTNDYPSTTSPLLGVDDDAESVNATEVSSTGNPLLADDGEYTGTRPTIPRIRPDETITEIENSVEDLEDAEAARQSVAKAVDNVDKYDPDHPEPIQALNAMPMIYPDELNTPPDLPPPITPQLPMPDENGRQTASSPPS